MSQRMKPKSQKQSVKPKKSHSIKLESPQRTFVTGLLAILPLAITIYIFWLIIVSTERLSKYIVTAVSLENYYVPGVGFILAVLLVYVVGLIASFWLGQKLLKLGERLLDKVPLVKTIYGSIRDFLGYFNSSKEHQLNKPVLIEHPQLKMRILGFITQDDPSKLPAEVTNRDDKEEIVAVYLPMSYQIGGFTIFVPLSRITPVDMPIEQAMKFVITAGVSAKE